VRRLLALVVLASACRPAPRTVTGEIFIVTKAGPSIKLGLVKVTAIPLDGVDTLLLDQNQRGLRAVGDGLRRADSLTDQVTAAGAEVDRLRVTDPDTWFRRVSGKLDTAKRQLTEALPIITAAAAYRTPGFWLNNPKLPLAESTAESDADGKFALLLRPNRRYAIRAQTSRQVGATTERLAWFVAFDPAKDSIIRLANANRIETTDSSNLLRGEVFDLMLGQDHRHDQQRVGQ
jgi:hypothetical protein